MMTTTNCPACHQRGGTVINRRDGKTGEPLVVVQCAHCGIGHVEPMPTPEALEQWYSTRYRQDYKGAVSPKLSHVLRAARLALERWDWASGQSGFRMPARSLDIGASSGEWVYLMHSLGVTARGVEPHQGYSAFARESLGLDVVAGSLQQRLPEMLAGGLDLVSMFHVLEHVCDPVQTLRSIARVLSPQGLVFIEVPDVAGLSSPKNTFFRAHTLYFSAHSLRSVAQAAGFEVAAQNFEEGGNLRVLLRVAGAPAPANWQPSDALVRGQQARRWSNYLLHRLKEGHAWRRHLRRLEEKRTAAGHADARSLLDATYAAHVARRRSVPA
jgi:2-polyprenyl-3-methyl-5-hydroxy-6-metoxy-1,4-benzoquinol methylase